MNFKNQWRGGLNIQLSFSLSSVLRENTINVYFNTCLPIRQSERRKKTKRKKKQKETGQTRLLGTGAPPPHSGRTSLPVLRRICLLVGPHPTDTVNLGKHLRTKAVLRGVRGVAQAPGLHGPEGWDLNYVSLDVAFWGVVQGGEGSSGGGAGVRR